MVQMKTEIAEESENLLKVILRRALLVFVFSVAFAYIEAAVVVYLREIFHPEGFSFPLTNFGIDPRWRQLLLTEIGREAATMLLILSAAALLGRTSQQRFALFLAIFAIWDIFFYVWLKILINWPSSLMDWDILFLIPTTWAGPVLAPVLVSAAMFAFSVLMLSRSWLGHPLEPSRAEWAGFVLSAVVVVVSFCIAGGHVTEPDFERYFSWSLFGMGCVTGIALFLRLLRRSKRPG
jgi:hypothetical protein